MKTCSHCGAPMMGAKCSKCGYTAKAAAAHMPKGKPMPAKMKKKAMPKKP